VISREPNFSTSVALLPLHFMMNSGIVMQDGCPPKMGKRKKFETFTRGLAWLSCPSRMYCLYSYHLARCTLTSSRRPGIRIQYAHFEESQGRVDMARAVLESILEQRKGCPLPLLDMANFL